MDASMNSAIAATIPLLTAPLADICTPSALDSLHVLLMSTLSEHLAPTWDPARPSLGAAARTLHLSSSSNAPRPLAHAAASAGIKASSWVQLLLAHYRRSTAMSISIDPGMVAIQFAGSQRPVVFWQEDVSPVSSRAVSPVESHSRVASSSVSAEAPWNARKSRLPSLVAASARQANPSSTPKAMPFGSPRTPQSFSNFSFPSQQSLPTNEELFGGEVSNERRWLGQVLDLFPETPAVDSEPEQVSSKLNASAPVYRPPHARSHSRTDSTSSYSSSSSSSSSSSPSSRSDSRRPTLTPASVAAAAAAAHAHAQQHQQMGMGIYGHLALNMSQLSLASTSSTAPSLSSASTTSSHSSASSYRAASPTSSASDEYQVPAPVKYMDADLPSPLSPTASAYAYVDHAARRDVTEYECGKVGVLGGAVMLGVPAHKKRNSGSSQLPKRGAVPSW